VVVVINSMASVGYHSATLAIPPVFLYHLKYFFNFCDGILAFKGMLRTIVHKFCNLQVNPVNNSQSCVGFFVLSDPFREEHTLFTSDRN
jgi:hypothetical protein